MLDWIKELDEDYVEPGDEGYQEYQHVKTMFYSEIRDLESECAVNPDRVVDYVIDRDYDAVEYYLSRELEEETSV